MRRAALAARASSPIEAISSTAAPGEQISQMKAITIADVGDFRFHCFMT